jgi:hypothetical protein
MGRPKVRPSAELIDTVLGEASWVLSHAQALEDEGREEAPAEWARAAVCAEQAASLLDASGQSLEAAIQRVSAASCLERVGEYSRAVTLLRAALSAPLREDFRARVEHLLARCLAQAHKALSKAGPRKLRKQSPAAS